MELGPRAVLRKQKRDVANERRIVGGHGQEAEALVAGKGDVQGLVGLAKGGVGVHRDVAFRWR